MEEFLIDELVEDEFTTQTIDTLITLPYDDAFLIIANLIIGMFVGYVAIRGLLDPWKSF